MNDVVLWVEKDNVSVYLNLNMPTANIVGIQSGTITYDDSGASSYNVNSTNQIVDGN
jgi:hypothetical protein